MDHNLNHYFYRPLVTKKIFRLLIALDPWNYPLTPGVDPRGWPWIAPGQAAPPEELEYAREAGIF